MPPVADTNLSLTDLGATESTIILVAFFLLLLASTLICTCGCCGGDQRKQEGHPYGDNVVEQPPDTISKTESDEDTRSKGRKSKKKKDWASFEEKEPRRPIMPVTAELMVLPEHQKYVNSWSIKSKTESRTSKSSDDRSRSKQSSQASDGLKVVLKYNLTRPRKESDSVKEDVSNKSDM